MLAARSGEFSICMPRVFQNLAKTNPRIALGKIVEASELAETKLPVKPFCLPALRPQPQALKILRPGKLFSQLHQSPPETLAASFRRYPDLIDVHPVPERFRGQNTLEISLLIKREPLDALFPVVRSGLLFGMRVETG